MFDEYEVLDDGLQSGGHQSNGLFDGNFNRDSYFKSFSTKNKRKKKRRSDIVFEDITYWEEMDMKRAIRKNIKSGVSFEERKREKEKKIEAIPDYVKRDVFKLFYNKEIEYKITSATKKYWHIMLSEFNNYLLKSVTRGHFRNSAHVTRACMEAMVQLQENTGSKDFNEMMKNAKAGDKNAPGSMQELMASVAKDAHKRATVLIKEEKAKEDKMKALGFEPGDMSPDELEFVENFMDDNSVSLPSRKEFDKFVYESIKTINSGFSGECKSEEEGLLDSDDLEDIEDLFNLSHVALYQDVININKKYHKSFDLYLDISSSMGSGVASFNMPRILLCKLLAIRLVNMNIINDVYLFNSSVVKSDKYQMLKVRHSGGTSINKVRDSIEENGNSSMIITDGEASYSSRVKSDVFMFCIGTSMSRLKAGYGNHEGFKILAKENRIAVLENGKLKTYS